MLGKTDAVTPPRRRFDALSDTWPGRAKEVKQYFALRPIGVRSCRILLEVRRGGLDAERRPGKSLRLVAGCPECISCAYVNPGTVSAVSIIPRTERRPLAHSVAGELSSSASRSSR